MHELLTKIFTHARLAWRHRWLALVVMSVICALGGVYVMSLPDTYSVSAKLHVDTNSLLKPVLRGLALNTNAGAEAVALMRRTLLVRPNLEEIARVTDLDLQAETPAEMEHLLEGLRENIQLSQTSRENIFTIAYEDSEPVAAKRVVDAVLNLFLERSLGEARRGTVATQEFIEKQVKEYEAKLQAAETRLKEFKQKNIGFLPGAATDYVSRQEALVQSLQDARLQRQEAISRRDALEEQLEDSDDPALYIPFSEEWASPLDSRIQQLEERIDELLLRYTERHPDVVIARQLIDDLKSQRIDQVESISAGDVNVDPNVANPIFQGLKVALSAADAEVAALEGRVAEYEKRVEAAADLVDQALRVEGEFSQLNRNYGILQKNYQSFADRREQTEIGIDADQSAENVQVRVMEPPRVPLLPTGPERQLLSVLVALLGMAAGIGAAWLVSVVNPVYFDVEQLAASLRQPILGAVSFSGFGAFGRPRHEVLTYVTLFAAVLTAYASLIILAPVDHEVLRDLSRLWAGTP